MTELAALERRLVQAWKADLDEVRRDVRELDEDVFGKRAHRDKGALGRVEEKVDRIEGKFDRMVLWIQALAGTVLGGVIVGAILHVLHLV